MSLDDFFEPVQPPGPEEDVGLSSPCWKCYRTDHTVTKKGKEEDTFETYCTKCGTSQTYKLPGMWRVLGLE